jgi:hypothetical protein
LFKVDSSRSPWHVQGLLKGFELMKNFFASVLALGFVLTAWTYLPLPLYLVLLGCLGLWVYGSKDDPQSDNTQK